MTLPDVFDRLKAIGFTDYEARAYSALLSISPANGYQVSQNSGVPRAKIYETLERLVSRGAAVHVQCASGNTKSYAPMAPDELIAGIERATKEACDRARDALRHVLTDTRVMEVLYRVISQRDLVARGISLAAEATEVLHVALWPEEFDELAEELCAAVMRGVKLALIVYGEHEATERLRSMGAGAVQHGESKHEAVPILGRQFVLVADRSRCITGSIFAPNHVEGVFTMNRGLVANAVDLVNHEIYVERILEEVGEPVWQRFGRHLEQLDSFDQPITNGHKRTK